MTALAGAKWRKSSRSANNNQCVEVATNLDAVVGVRDSKDPHGPAFTLSHAAFAAFINDVKKGAHNL